MTIPRHFVFGLAVVAMVAISVSVRAGDSGYGHPQYGDGFDYAPVIGVTPVYTDVQVRTPRTQCWDQQVAYPGPGSATGTIVGGLIGAAVGNASGKRHGHRRYHRRHHHHGGREARTVAGALIGAAIGHSVSRHQNVQYVTEQRCQVVDEYTTQRELVGYDVRYRYNGREFLTRTQQHPGDRIRVRVDVTPVH